MALHTMDEPRTWTSILRFLEGYIAGAIAVMVALFPYKSFTIAFVWGILGVAAFLFLYQMAVRPRWLAWGPVAIFCSGAVFVCPESDKKVWVINGRAHDRSIAIVLPFWDAAEGLSTEHTTHLTDVEAPTKEGVLIRGNISATFSLLSSSDTLFTLWEQTPDVVDDLQEWWRETATTEFQQWAAGKPLNGLRLGSRTEVILVSEVSRGPTRWRMQLSLRSLAVVFRPPA